MVPEIVTPVAKSTAWRDFQVASMRQAKALTQIDFAMNEDLCPVAPVLPTQK